MEEKITFAVAGDPHTEIMHDGIQRMRRFLAAAREADADFIIHLGDLTYPNDCTGTVCPIDGMPENIYDAYRLSGQKDNESVIGLFENCGIPAYHVMGNHEFDFSSPEDVLRLYRVPGLYYSFHRKGWHFIVLDPNFMRNPAGELEHYSRGQYFYKRDLPYLPPEQLAWLAEELASSDEPAIIFSHQPLYSRGGAIKNHGEFAAVIDAAREAGKDVRMCVNGHLHLDGLTERGGILYYSVNSMSNQWVGKGYAAQGRFSEETEQANPSLQYVIPYRDAVYSIVTLDVSGVSVKGVDTDYVRPGPEELSYKGEITSGASSWARPWKK